MSCYAGFEAAGMKRFAWPGVLILSVSQPQNTAGGTFPRVGPDKMVNECGLSKPFLKLFCPLSVVPFDASSPICCSSACYFWEPLGTLIALIGRAAGSLASLLKLPLLLNNGFLMINPLNAPVVGDREQQTRWWTLKRGNFYILLGIINRCK